MNLNNNIEKLERQIKDLDKYSRATKVWNVIGHVYLIIVLGLSIAYLILGNLGALDCSGF